MKSYTEIAQELNTEAAVIDPPQIWYSLWEGYGKGTRDKVAYDIGANCGQTLEIELTRFDRVVAFEPARESFAVLQRYIAEHEHSRRMACYQMAVSDTNGECTLIELADKIDTGQLVSVDAAGMEYNPNDPHAVKRFVPCITVDHMHEFGAYPPDFLKIDVEGHELKVLIGAAETLNQYRPDLLIEIHSADLGWAIREYLRPFGYTLEVVRHPHYASSSDLYLAHYWLKAIH